MKKAFTMLELIMVIVVIGILAVVVIPRTGSNSLGEAAVQLVSHIRYTQHLAMVDDKFDTTDANWYRGRWQIVFENIGTEPKYSIFSDGAGYSGNADDSEVALDTLDKSKILSGGGNSITVNAPINEKLNLAQSYGIDTVALSANCRFALSQRIAFDNMGRPLKGAFHNYTSSYPAASRLITNQCTITLSEGADNVVIAIEPETGYTHIL